MANQPFEDSLEDGSPIELYLFRIGVEAYGFTTAEIAAYTFQNITYLGESVKRDRIKQVADVLREGVKITFPRSNDFARLVAASTLEQPVTLTIYRGHIDDPDQDFQTYWKGRVVGPAVTENEIEISCESLYSSLKRAGLRRTYELTCTHVLYSETCGATDTEFRTSSDIYSIIDNRTFLCTDANLLGNDYLKGGKVQFPSGAQRMIVDHTGDTIKVSRPSDEIEGTTQVYLFAGCDKSRSTCVNKFNNVPNFGGFPWISRNPFDGTSIA